MATKAFQEIPWSRPQIPNKKSGETWTTPEGFLLKSSYSPADLKDWPWR